MLPSSVTAHLDPGALESSPAIHVWSSFLYQTFEPRLKSLMESLISTLTAGGFAAMAMANADEWCFYQNVMHAT
jgi:hypothetical protein